MVVNADGTNVHTVTTDPIRALSDYYWSPDGSQIVFGWTPGVDPAISLAATDGSGVRTLDLGMPVEGPFLRPPDGAVLLYRGTAMTGITLNTVPLAGGTPTLVSAAADSAFPSSGRDNDLKFASYSPDGSQIVYSSWAPDVKGRPMEPVRIHIMKADGTGDRLLPVLDADNEDWAMWSPDGTHLSVVTRTGGQHRLAIVPADGNGPVVATAGEDDPGGLGQAASPDGSTILTWRSADGIIKAVDAKTGASTTMPWTSDGNPDWQRLAP